jgi:hypothetical protein
MLRKILRWLDEYAFLRYGHQFTTVKYEEPISTCLIPKEIILTDEDITYGKQLAEQLAKRSANAGYR